MPYSTKLWKVLIWTNLISSAKKEDTEGGYAPFFYGNCTMRIQTSTDWLEHLQKYGFVCVSLDEKDHQVVQRVLQYTEKFSSFRFPPIEGNAIYTQDIRDVFELFYAVSREVLAAVLHKLPDGMEKKRLQQNLLASNQERLFVDTNSPFRGEEDFAGTFFNLFHYDYGCLNTHKDRYLITVIAVLPAHSIHDPDAPQNQHSCLWVQSPKGEWNNVDHTVQERELIVFVGEELQRISMELGEGLYACDHCIRVDPRGDYISHSHHRRDPQSLPTGNRCSIALVLGERHE